MNDQLNDLPVGQAERDNQNRFADGHPSTDSQRSHETHRRYAVGHPLPVGHVLGDTHTASADGHPSTDSHSGNETHGGIAVGHPLPVGHESRDTHSRIADGHSSDGWAELRICGDLFDRSQAERIAIGNMLLHTDADYFGEHLARLEATEHAARLLLRRCYKRVVPAEIRDWQTQSKGVGTDSLARILGHLGDPYIATPHWWEGTGSNRQLVQGDPYVRTIAQLWAYCGHGDPTRRPRKGMTADETFAMGNPKLKMLVHLQAEWCMRAPGRYRDVYLAARAAAENKVHGTDCVRCGPSGKPAVEGSPWSKGHQHAHALRIVGKELLRDMWLVRHHAVQGFTAKEAA